MVGKMVQITMRGQTIRAMASVLLCPISVTTGGTLKSPASLKTLRLWWTLIPQVVVGKHYIC